MTLVSGLAKNESSSLGELQYTVVAVASLTGLQEPEPGWLLCNGAVVPSSGFAPSGAAYAPLNGRLGSRFGPAGTLPDLTNGITPVTKGISAFTTVGQKGGATDVGLSPAHIASHATHSIVVWYPTGPLLGDGNPYCFQSGNYQYPLKNNVQNGVLASNYAGSGTSHENMPPFIVIEACLVKL